MLTSSCRDSARQISVAVEMLCLLNFRMCLFTITVVLWREVWRKNMIQERFERLWEAETNSCSPEVNPCPMKTIWKSLFAFGAAVCQLQASKPLASYPGSMREKNIPLLPRSLGKRLATPLPPVSMIKEATSLKAKGLLYSCLLTKCLLSRRIHK